MEETNRIRSMLGLNLLKVGMSWENKEKAAIGNYQAQLEKEENIRIIDGVREKIGKAKEKRVDRAQLKGIGLAEVDAARDTNLLSTIHWVMKSRSTQKSDNQYHEHNAEKTTSKLQRNQKGLAVK